MTQTLIRLSAAVEAADWGVDTGFVGQWRGQHKPDASALSFATGIVRRDDYLGRVASVDTSRVLISVEAHQHMADVAVGNLIAICGRTAREYLTGMVERATRSVTEKPLADEPDDDEGDIPLGEVQQDSIKVVRIGTYRSVDGVRTNLFKRGMASSSPGAGTGPLRSRGP